MKQWTDYTLHDQATFAIGMLIAGFVISAGLYAADAAGAAVIVAMNAGGAAVGVLINLRQRLGALRRAA